ncbi:MAG TPA: AAA family ATPase [Paucimonas sp.]|nr:AAA family ATPase [Paucimonas sp.]
MISVPHKAMFFRRAAESEDGAVLEVDDSFDLGAALDFAMALAERLREVHARSEAHLAVCPANIRIADGGAIELRDEAPMPLAYVSPEQTGRMNRRVDYRSDFYSLGVTLYEVFTGHLPFESDNPMEVVHGHIAKKPLAPLAVNLELPSVVSDIIARLLAKNAEDRYQSLDGLLADLRQCRLAFADNGTVPSFPLGQHDVCERLQLPQRLYGREAEVGQLIGAFNRIADGGAEMLLVVGYSGIGKSALVNEIHKPVAARRGYFVAGKFDQFKRSVPYSAINDALRELIRQILTESEARIAQWREKLLKALGPNGQMVIDVIPELEYIIGKQQVAPQLGAGRNSYNYVMQNFVGVFARAEHPLVIFLDDLQWADAASLKLLALLMRSLEQPCLLLIAAYRNNEVGAAHPVMMTIDEIRKDARVSTIEVQALPQSSVVELVSDTVQSRRQPAAALAQLVYSKTRGNPFFVGQFIKSIHNEGLLRFEEGGWCWNVEQIEALGITDNVIDLLTRELRRLPAKTHRLLTLAACIGNRFDVRTLATVSETSEEITADALRQAVQAGLLTRPDAGLAPGGEAERSVYHFLHDRVQQAAYDDIPQSEKKAVHLKIGRLLVDSLSAEEQEERLFDIVHQLNEGRGLLDDEGECDRLARLNLRAAKKARASAAFDMHRECVEIAREFGAVKPWSLKQAFMHELYMEMVSAAFARADYAEMERLCNIVSANAASAQEAIVAKEMLVRCYGAAYNPEKLLQTGIALAELSGIRMPDNLGPRHIQTARLRLAFALRGRDPLDLADFPEATDPQYLLQLQATTAFLAYGLTYLAGSNVVLWLALEMIRKSIRHGVSPYCAYAYAVWGRTLSGRLGKPLEGYKFGKVAAILGARKYLLGAVGIYQGIIRHRCEHLNLSLQPLLDTYVKAMEVGDRAGAVVALQFSDAIRFQSGGRVDDAYAHILKDIEIYRKMDYSALLGVMLPWAQLFADLVGQSVEHLTQGRTMDDFVQARKKASDPWGVFYVRTIQCIDDYYFGRYGEALLHAAEAIGLPGFDYGTPSSAYLMFFHSLAQLALCDSHGGAKLAALAKVTKMQRRFRPWARHAPMNYLHKWQLVEAERQRVLGNPRPAKRFYQQAIKGARRHGFPNDEALAHELLAKFHLHAGEELLARLHMEEALAKYEEWGGHAKAWQLQENYPTLLSRALERRRAEQDRAEAPAEQHIDVDTIIKASQMLSGEIQLERLLERVMQLLIRNAGAQRGALLAQKDGALTIQAAALGESIEVLRNEAVERNAGLSLAVINYVRRTGSSVVLGDADNDPRFNLDPYIRREHPKSLMCIPLLKQSELIGMLYLENNLAADAFTPQHTELLQILSTQIAISLENAGLYNELEQKIEARTLALRRKNDELNETLQSLRQAQKQLIESEKLASLGQLVAGVAHEINTPVGVAVTAASTLSEETGRIESLYRTGAMKRSDLEKFVDSAATISKLLLSNMERAATLVQSFKEVAIDQTSQERRSFNLKNYIDEVLLNLTPILRKTEHRIEVECDEMIEVDTYPGALSQVLTNLVMNALIHAFEEGERGAMAIKVTQPDTATIELCFSDNGKGIPAEHLPKIFDPFFTTMRGRGGSGLGLNIAYNLVSGSLQGVLSVTSEVGAGTVFTLRFPRNPARSADARSRPAAASADELSQ